MNRTGFLHFALLPAALIALFAGSPSSYAQEHEHFDGCLVQEEQSIDPVVVAAMRKHGREKSSDEVLALPAPTIESVVGKTIAVVFYIEVDEGISMGPYWSPALYSQVSENIHRNCDWWEDVGRAHGKEVEIEVIEYAHENPVPVLNWDPTQTTTPGEFIKDRSFYDTVMNRLGYTLGNSAEKMTAFCQDIAATNDADQAFIIWLIVGRNAVRSNAAFNGPSTNVWYKSAQTGWTTAHEMGHIFGAFDEYYEEGTEVARSKQSRNGAPNDNLAYRNHPIVPCMMSNSHTEGVCSYTAVHVGLSDFSRSTAILPNHPNATYEVRYWDPALGSDGAFGTAADRFQGATHFPWGAGMRVELTGLDSICDFSFQTHIGPRWGGSGTNTLEVEVDTSDSDLITLSYLNSESIADRSIRYLAPDVGPMGGYVYGIIPLAPGVAAFASRDGVSIYNLALEHVDSLRTVLDYPFRNGRDEGPRRGYSIAIDRDSILWFGTQSSEILRWDGDTTLRLVGPVAGQNYRAVVVTPDGDLWGGYEAGLHRFHDGSDQQITTYSSARGELIGESVQSLAVDVEGALWIGTRGARSQGGGGGGLQRFDPASDAWTDFSTELGGATINSISTWDDMVAVATSNGFSIYDGERWNRFEPGNDFHRNVMDVTADAAGRLVLATFGGIYRMVENDVWERFGVENSLVPENIYTTVTIDPNGMLWAGTLDGTVVLIRFNEASSAVAESIVFAQETSFDISPNPTVDDITATFRLEERGDVVLVLYDETGRERLRIVDGDLPYGTHSFRVPTDELESGVYWLEMKRAGGRVARGVVVE